MVNSNQKDEEQLAPEERVRDMIQQAEAAKARMFAATGNKQLISASAIIDEGYVVVGAHLDDQMVAKIKKGEYVDFGKLIPRDRVVEEEW